MTLPKRWLEDENAEATMRDVLRAGRDMDPPADAEKAVWLALVGQIGAAGAAGAAAAGASAKGAAAGSAAAGTGAASGGLLKAILIGTFSGIVAVSGYSVVESRLAPPEGAPSTVAPPPAISQRPAPGQVAPAAAPSSEPSSAPASSASPATPQGSSSASASSPMESSPSGAAPSAAPEPSVGAGSPVPGSAEERESRLREEAEMLQQARAALRGGDTGNAMRLLEQARQKFPGGVLGQEREALTIESLARAGARDVASARAAAFIKAHPQSPHAARLQPYVQPQ